MPRIDALLTCKFKKFNETCPECAADALVFEEAAKPSQDGSTLDVLLLCTACGHRVRIQIEA